MAVVNDFSNVLGTIFAQGLMALREACVMPRLINSDYSADAAGQGQVVTIEIPSAATAVDIAVSGANVAPDPANLAPTKATITLSNWKEAAFVISDKEMREIHSTRDYRSKQVTEHVRVLANAVNTSVFALYPKVYGYTGTAGTTPFATDTTAATQARRILNTQLAPLNPRAFVVDPDAEANALGLRAFQDASFRGDSAGLIEGQMGRKLGFQFAMDQQVPTHTAGTASGATTTAAGFAVGVKTVALASAGTGTILVGDVITFAGDTQTYTVTSGDADVSNGGSISFEPGLASAIPTSATAITVKATHTVNLAFHRDAFGFASRILQGDEQMTAAEAENVMQVADPVSGLTLRLERRREYYRTRWAFSILWGCAVIRPECATRVAG